MTDLTTKNFGLVIAFLIPGFLIVLSAESHSSLIASWLGGSIASAPTVGGFLFITLAAIAAGMMVSIVRWLLIDTIHHHTGIKRPEWNFARLPENLEAFESTVDNHYRYYQAYANLLVAIMVAVLLHPRFPTEFGYSPTIGYSTITLLAVLLFVASRDAMQKYYARTSAILSSSDQETSNDERLA